MLKDLNDRRIEILGEVSKLEPLARVTHEQIHAHNEIMDEIERLQESRSKDPLTILPREIWEDIIHRAINTDSEDRQDWNVDQLIDLTSISKAWEDAIMSTASFWANVRVDSVLEDMEAKAALCLQLSRDAPLTVALNVETNVEHEAIICESHRIRSLTLHVRTHYYPESNQQARIGHLIGIILQNLGDHLILESLVVDMWGLCTPTVDDFLRRCFSLKHLGGVRILDSTIQLESLKRLRRLTLVEPLQTTLPLLSCLKDLEDVTFFNIPTHLTDNQAIMTDHKPIGETQLFPWRSLGYYQSHYGTTFISLLNSSSSSLVSINVFIKSSVLTKFLSILSTLENLNSIAISVHYLTRTKLDPQPDIGTTRVQRLSMSIGLDYEWNNLDSVSVSVPVTENLAVDSVSKTFEMMTVLAPNVRYLDITTTINSSAALMYASSLQDLRKMNLQLLCGVQATEERVFPSVEEVVVSENILFMTSQSFPNVIGLVCRSERSGPVTPLEISLSYWFNIRHLDISVDSLDFDKINLPHLQKLIYSVTKHSNRSQIHEVLATQPYKFPSLTYLGHRWPPEWDILFIMLERRNFSCDSHVLPIKQLAFPCLPPPIILRPLKARLLSRLSDRPSNFEISVQSNLEIYLDMNV